MKKFISMWLLPLVFACNKKSDPIVPAPVPVVEKRLKALNWQSLPSPYYHFAYDNAGRIVSASHAAGIRNYQFTYSGSNIQEVKNNAGPNQDRLLYHYENGKVTAIKYINKEGENYQRCFLAYNEVGQLKSMEWETKLGTVGFAQQRTVSFVYYSAGDVKERRDQLHAIPGLQEEALHVDLFENYDQGNCADEFMLLHNPNEHMIFLPGIRIQKHNPAKITRTGTGLQYSSEYVYVYDSKGWPISKTGKVRLNSGPNAGQEFQVNIGYSYYD